MAERAHPDDPGFQGTIYEKRMHDRYQFAARFVAGMDLLDSACGTCWGWIHLGNARSLTGFDVSEHALHEARRLGFGQRLAAAEMGRLPFGDASFDVVVCLEAIEHIQPTSAVAFLAECQRVLRPGGTIVLSTPLRSDSRHSGNPFHVVEYTEEEIRGLLAAQFECTESRIEDDGEDGPPIFLFAGSLRPNARPAALHWSPNNIQERAARWLAGVAAADGFRFSSECPATVTSTAIGVLLAEGLGWPSELPVTRPSLADTLQSAQDPDSGLFTEPLASTVAQEGSLHDEEYFHWMTTYFAIQALDSLGEKPRYRLKFLNAFPDRQSVWSWLDGLDWSNPWRESNRAMVLMAALLFRLQWENDAAAAERYHDVLDWLDERQDPQTGLWGVKQGASLLNAVAGAYHFVPFYRYARRPVRGWSKIVNACLELQQEDGLFGPAPGGGACEDLDVIDLLCNAARATGRLEPEIRQALTRAFWAIWNMQLPEGGFPYARVEGGATYNFSSWPATSAKVNGGDVWATWFRLCALHTIRSLLGDDLPEIGPWTFRRVPALGFHLQDTAIPEDAPAAHRCVWFRPLAAPPAPEAPRAAVVVTCYNLGQYLYESLASVATQTLRQVETVIVDDGSTDPYTIARLDALAHDGWRVIRTENRGLPAARNLGIQHTRAPFICCLDADDRLRPEYLEKAAAALEANPRAGFVSCFYELFDEATGSYRYPRPQLPRMLARNEAVVSSLFRRQAWMDAGGYCESLPAMQDWDFWISILEKGWEGGLLPEVLFDYRIRAGSMYSETQKPENFSRIASMIYSRHGVLYQTYISDVLRLQSKVFAENTEFMRRQEAAWNRALRDLRRLAARAPAPPPPAEPAQPHEPPAPPPSLARTIFWALLQSAHPRGRWRGARNLMLFARAAVKRQARALWRSFFDPAFYTANRRDVAEARIWPAIHYALAGAWENADPSESFSTAFYLKRHSDVASAEINPLLHFALFGAREGRVAASPLSAGEQPAFSAFIRRDGDLHCEPLVSVIIPCFNYGHYLEEAVQSVLRQTLSNLEVLVVEGGSTDPETVARVRRLEKAGLPRVRFFYRDKPSLAGDNRNFAIAQARGRYVCCLDADDVIEPSYLEAAIFLAEYGDADFVSTSLQAFGEDTTRWLVDVPQWPAILHENQVCTVALFRREIWESLGGYRDWGKGEDHLPEDWDFWIRAVAAGYRGAVIRTPMLRYRVRSSSLSRHRTKSYRDWARRLAAENFSLLGRNSPAPRPGLERARVAWASIEEVACGPAVLMALPFFTEGGAEKIFLALAREWRRRAAKVVVITTLELAREAPDRLEAMRRLTPHVFAMPEVLWNREDASGDFLYYLLRRHRISLIYFAGCDLLYQLLPLVRQEFPRITVVDQLFNDEIHFYTNRAFARWIDCTVVPSERVLRRLRDEYGESDARVAVIPHGVKLPRASPASAPALPPGFAGKPLVGFFGRLSPEKGPLDFVHIAASIHKMMPDARFVMTGEGPEQNAVRKEIRRRLDGVLHAPGFVEDVRPWIAACDVVIVPSRLDGMPLIVFEAQALGKPVVASRVGSVPEMIADGGTGVLCEPGDIDAFASAALRLLQDAGQRRRMGEAGRERIHREFREEIMIERYFRLFERVAGSGKNQAALRTAGP